LTRDNPTVLTLRVIEAIERTGARYFVVGSLASIVHGQPRATLDSDVVADLHAAQVPQFLHTLGTDFYADEVAIADAVRSGRSFNVIHMPTAFKVDIYGLTNDAFAQEEMRRRRRESLQSEPIVEAFVATPEDVVLSKLRWYRDGGEVSDRQWGDVLGVLRVQQGRLDQAYMRMWAKRLGVVSLLDGALTDD
jgi:hypothetical protein